jgi:hypothetical protein
MKNQLLIIFLASFISLGAIAGEEISSATHSSNGTNIESRPLQYYLSEIDHLVAKDNYFEAFLTVVEVNCQYPGLPAKEKIVDMFISLRNNESFKILISALSQRATKEGNIKTINLLNKIPRINIKRGYIIDLLAVSAHSRLNNNIEAKQLLTLARKNNPYIQSDLIKDNISFLYSFSCTIADSSSCKYNADYDLVTTSYNAIDEGFKLNEI